jgi:DNA-binding response OmpR family regulator
MMLTAKIEEIDRLLGLELGAHDYICKPYSPCEVVARVKAVLRRFQPPTPSMQGIIVDKKRLKVTVNGEDTKLTIVELELFTMLFENLGYIFSRNKIWIKSIRITVSSVIELLIVISRKCVKKFNYCYLIRTSSTRYMGLATNLNPPLNYFLFSFIVHAQLSFTISTYTTK